MAVVIQYPDRDFADRLMSILEEATFGVASGEETFTADTHLGHTLHLTWGSGATPGAV